MGSVIFPNNITKHQRPRSPGGAVGTRDFHVANRDMPASPCAQTQTGVGCLQDGKVGNELLAAETKSSFVQRAC